MSVITGFAFEITGTGVCHDAEGYLLDSNGNRVVEAPSEDKEDQP